MISIKLGFFSTGFRAAIVTGFGAAGPISPHTFSSSPKTLFTDVIKHFTCSKNVE